MAGSADFPTLRGFAGVALTDWDGAAGLLASRLPPSIAHLFGSAFIHSSDLYEEFVTRHALEVFRTTGLEPVAQAAGSAEEIATRAGLATDRACIPLGWILRRLATWDLLEVAGGGDGAPCRYRASCPLPSLDPAAIREEQRQLDPSWLPSYTLAELAARHYPAFLRGEATGEEILLSPARLGLWGEFFSNANRLYAVNNLVGAIAVDSWMPRRPGVILELGGGLASAAVALLERLEASGRLADVREYRFTELVPAFLRRGQRALDTRFPGLRALASGQLDMNRAFADQGVEPGSVSVVYAVNTLHVAHDLEFTLGEVYQALAPGGLLVASECARPFPKQGVYVEFVFNLLETFRAPRLAPPHRPNGGFLTPEQWTGALRAAGFADVRLLPDIARLRGECATFYVAAVGATRPA